MPANWVKSRMKQQPGRAQQHCTYMRQEKAQYALGRLKARYTEVTGKDWVEGVSARFGVEPTMRAWAVAGLAGAGFAKVEEYLKRVVEAAQINPPAY
ncbi:hypothetical protein [uncultured Paludibaculum sp.]|uniref:hypothetical protein n=1 Tax=uncultured Paludibaculum sp. TaxID=1765020 RepID=UPI002AAC0965|nr:hypothetical protein [uncultured Paludibaculum sp.]